LERDDPRAGAHPRAPSEPAALDRLQDEARRAHPAQPEVCAEGREEVGGDRGGGGAPRRPKNERALRRRSRVATGWSSSLEHAPASPVARPPPESSAG